jgi:hypothetical protein
MFFLIFPPFFQIIYTIVDHGQARIMAAKEKSQQAKVAPAPTTTTTTADLLMDFDAPSTGKDPPPSYDTNFLAGMAPPPAFDAMENNNGMNQMQQQQLLPPTSLIMDFPPPPPIDFVMPPPPPPMENILPPPPPLPEAMMMMAPYAPAASAPSFEDLLGGTVQPFDVHPPPLPPPVQEEAAAALDIDESILNALDPAEREAFLEEQRKIMEQIEMEKVNKHQPTGAAARAAAFDQRSTAAVAQVAASYEGRARPEKSSNKSSSNYTSSSSAGVRTVNLGEGTQVPLHGQEKTKKAIEDGTAVIVQCMSCSNWMQVTGEAEVMFCPICQTVCHVEKKGAATSANMEAAAQMAADAELAEKLQKEEYSIAAGGSSGSSSTRRRQARAPAPAASAAGQSWYDWFVGAPAPEPAAALSSNSRSAEIRPQRGLVAATTGEEAGVGRSRSYDESEGLMNGGGGGARVAQQKSMFACVADSITDAAHQMTSYSLSEDQEGNVHGVDSSSLLAMPDVSRRKDHESS